MATTPAHGYTAHQHATWDRAFQTELQSTPDDGQSLDLEDWIDLTFLNRLFFVNPPAHTMASLMHWRMHAQTPLQRKAAERLLQKKLLTILDADNNYVRLSVAGYRKVGRVWEYMVSFVSQSETVKMPQLSIPTGVSS